MKTSPIPVRKVKTSLSQEHIKFFHKILCLVENDDAFRYKGYNWKNLKSSLRNEIQFENNSKNVRIAIPKTIQANSIYINEYDSIAGKFLKYLRHAFAHNYVSLDKEGNLNIILPHKSLKYEKNKTSGQCSFKLCCCISFDSLKKVIKQLEKQKNQKKTSKNKSK